MYTMFEYIMQHLAVRCVIARVKNSPTSLWATQNLQKQHEHTNNIVGHANNTTQPQLPKRSKPIPPYERPTSKARTSCERSSACADILIIRT